MPAKVQMNIKSLNSSPEVRKKEAQENSQKSSNNISMKVRINNNRRGNMNLFDISNTKKACKSCGGG